jgi:NADH:quinone reductase (non-electrogenic)
MARPKVVVIGAGFAGLAAVKALKHAPVDVTLVDANNFHTFQPLLYQVATAGLDADDVAYPVRGIFRRQRNMTFRMARATNIDLDSRVVGVDRGSDLRYDYLVLAVGAVNTDYGVPGVREHALELKSIADATRLRTHVLERFEAAATDPAVLEEGGLDIVICGGGPTGVEMAGALRELYTKVLARDFRTLDVAKARIIIVEAIDRLLGTFSRTSSARALHTLGKRGVEIILGTAVEKVDSGAVYLVDGRRLSAGTVIWTAGVQAHPLADSLGIAQGRGGRLVVESDLSVPGWPDVFVAGDVAAARVGGDLLPQVAQPAIQTGRHAGRQIARHVEGLPGLPFRYRDLGSMATIGRHDAISEFPIGVKLWGPIGWLAWLGLHLIELMGFRNRVLVFVSWAWNYLTFDRGSRMLSED